MKKSILCQIIFTSAIFFSWAQQLKGVVYYQNSDGKPAAGVRISAFNCNSTYSKTDGMFILDCTGKKPGQRLKLIIGYTDGEGKHIEVVNSQELEWLRIPDNPDDHVEIIIRHAGQRNEATLQYYNIRAENTHERLKDIETQLREQNLNASNTAVLITQIEELRMERDATLKKVGELEQRIASMNQNSNLVKATLQNIRKETIDAALAILNTPKLGTKYQSNLKKKQITESEVQQDIEAYKLKISLLLAEFKYEEVIYCYERMIKIYEDNNFDQETLAMLYTEATLALYDIGEFIIALEFTKNHLIFEKKL